MSNNPPRHFVGCNYHHYPGPCPNLLEKMRQRVWRKIAPLLRKENGYDR